MKVLPWSLRRDSLTVLAIICCSVIAILVVLSRISSPVPFELVAEGEMGSGRGRAPIMLAIRGDDPNRTVPDSLPDKAKETLREILAKPDPSLYVVVYAGLRGGTGHRLRINSMGLRRGIWGEQLVIKYSMDEPRPEDVLTHPFVIAHVSKTTIRAVDVVFERQ